LSHRTPESDPITHQNYFTFHPPTKNFLHVDQTINYAPSHAQNASDAFAFPETVRRHIKRVQQRYGCQVVQRGPEEATPLRQSKQIQTQDQESRCKENDCRK